MNTHILAAAFGKTKRIANSVITKNQNQCGTIADACGILPEKLL
jgi:hypothetical protein